MRRVGILAYGSLIGDPGPEIEPLIVERRKARTPFPIEFARASWKTRGGAPTLVRVRSGGSRADAEVLVLADHVTRELAADLLWRRETRNIGTNRHFNPTARRTADSMRVMLLRGIEGVDRVLYTSFSPNIRRRKPRKLAQLAVASARSPAVAQGKNGVTYLMEAERAGIRTPLMKDYISEVLRLTGATSLEGALRALTDGRDDGVSVSER